MLANEKFLNIPPYLSTSWEHITALRMEGNLLIITLDDANQIQVPDLSGEQVTTIFDAHSHYLNNQQGDLPQPREELRFGFTNMEGMQSALQHNPAQADASDIPPEVLEKIAAISRIVSPDEMTIFPEAEPHCNCPHCQIARVVNGVHCDIEIDHPENSGETVNDEELTFQEWAIRQSGDQLFIVTSADGDESYSVFLGDPVGCTCGKEGCEHILAVLRS